MPHLDPLRYYYFRKHFHFFFIPTFFFQKKTFRPLFCFVNSFLTYRCRQWANLHLPFESSKRVGDLPIRPPFFPLWKITKNLAHGTRIFTELPIFRPDFLDQKKPLKLEKTTAAPHQNKICWKIRKQKFYTKKLYNRTALMEQFWPSRYIQMSEHESTSSFSEVESDVLMTKEGKRKKKVTKGYVKNYRNNSWFFCKKSKDWPTHVGQNAKFSSQIPIFVQNPKYWA